MTIFDFLQMKGLLPERKEILKTIRKEVLETTQVLQFTGEIVLHRKGQPKKRVPYTQNIGKKTAEKIVDGMIAQAKVWLEGYLDDYEALLKRIEVDESKIRKALAHVKFDKCSDCSLCLYGRSVVAQALATADIFKVKENANERD